MGVRRTAEGVVGFAGLSTCGRIWLCPVCNAKVMALRALEIAAVLAWAQLHGLHVLFGALTVRHNAGSDLGSLLLLESEAWRIVVSGRTWRNASATLSVPTGHNDSCTTDCEKKHRKTIDGGGRGRVGYIRAAEITIGDNGWHPHFHPLVFVRGTKAYASKLAEQLVTEWVHAVESLGGEARAEGGQLMRVIQPSIAFAEVAGYVTKQTYSPAQRLALEAVWSQGKKSRGRAHSTSPHWVLLEELASGDQSRLYRWNELEAATHRHTMIAWSRGIRDFAGVGVELEDEKAAAVEIGTKDDTVCYITPEGWELVRDHPAVIVGYLDLLQEHGWGQLRVRLIADGVGFVVIETEAAA